MFPKERSKVGALETEELLITGDTEEEVAQARGQQSFSVKVKEEIF